VLGTNVGITIVTGKALNTLEITKTVLGKLTNELDETVEGTELTATTTNVEIDGMLWYETVLGSKDTAITTGFEGTNDGGDIEKYVSTICTQLSKNTVVGGVTLSYGVSKLSEEMITGPTPVSSTL